MGTFKRKFSVAFVIVFGAMFTMFLLPTSSVLAAENGSFQHNHAITIAVAPDTIYYEETRVFSSPGPSSIQVETLNFLLKVPIFFTPFRNYVIL